ncbi:nucleoside triphosphate pyrophosphatase [Limnobacter sp.]|uniref:Maf family protein n=1 Tax=Limnobacter sp. TaxID=2003368 RepID=UPI003510EFF6
MPNTPVHPSQCGLPETIWLASRSPRRKALLETLGLTVQVYLAQGSAEAEALEAPQAGEAPLPYVERVTRLKLQTALQAMQAEGLSGIVLAADTTVALHHTILGKPESPQQAELMLKQLSNTIHHVHTAVAVAKLGRNGALADVALAVQSSQVGFTHLPDSFIQAYIASGEPFDKAGAYGIQGIAGQYVSHISGSHSGIMGLPLFETGQLLRHIQSAAQSSTPKQSI